MTWELVFVNYGSNSETAKCKTKQQKVLRNGVGVNGVSDCDVIRRCLAKDYTNKCQTPFNHHHKAAIKIMLDEKMSK